MTNPLSVEQYLNSLPEKQQKLAKEIHNLILETSSEITQTLKWGYPCYAGAVDVCYLAGQTKHLNFGFYQGGLLPDPEKLLEGTGAKMRHIKIRSAVDIKPEAFRQLILEGLKMKPAKAKKSVKVPVQPTEN